MANSRSKSLIPSTSLAAIAYQNNDNDIKMPELKAYKEHEDEMFISKSLDIILRITNKLKTNDAGFITILDKVLSLVKGGNSSKRQIIYSLVEEVMNNILEADMDELVSAKIHFEKIFSNKKFKDVIKEEDLTRLSVIARGDFYYMLLGELKLSNGTRKRVCIKKAKSFEYNHVIENEALVLSRLKHPNIQKLFGKHEYDPENILELMDLGDLRSAVKEINFTRDNLLKILIDVASGMEFIVQKKYIHRDLDCSNVFLNKKKQCKIGCFGFAVYVGDSNGEYLDKTHNHKELLLSPETFTTRTFTVANDVWTMGVLCWDLFYITEHSHDLLLSPIREESLLSFRVQRVQLPKLDMCPDSLHRYIINDLLNEDPKRRPNFTSIKEKIKEIASSKAN